MHQWTFQKSTPDIILGDTTFDSPISRISLSAGAVASYPIIKRLDTLYCDIVTLATIIMFDIF